MRRPTVMRGGYGTRWRLVFECRGCGTSSKWGGRCVRLWRIEGLACKLARETAADALQLVLGVVAWVDAHAALTAAKRDVHHGTLERHERGEGLDLL